MIRFATACAPIALAVAAFAMPGAAFAQSSGTVDFEEESEEEIVVTGTRTRDVGGVITPDSPKARVVLTEELIRRQTPGQSVNEIINLVPGVSFQNNDPYGSSGGNLTIRGFDSTRVSQTFDGVPLNDSGNYQIYSNQQLDPELIEQVNVNLGTTDVDSPTASAVGGTVNYRTRVPGDDLGAMLVASYGEFNFHRVFGMIDTGAFTSFGTKAFISGSTARNTNPFNNFGQIDKQQYNARIYQPLGANGNFISLSGHYNQNRNNFGGSVALRGDRAVPGGFPNNGDAREYTVDRFCTVDTPQAGVADAPNSCGTSFDFRFNPSNTGNIRGASLFTFGQLTLSVDPSIQFVKANGGGTVNGNEGPRTVGGQPLFGYFGGQPFFGVDLNGDGDLRDRVTVIAPSQTKTRRYGVISSLAYDFNEEHRVRLAYTYDRARHRQTGEVGFVDIAGRPFDVFPVNDPISDVNGNVVQKRDRLSIALLNQVSGEYRGRFADDRFTVQAGVRLPFFERELNQNCFTTSASGFVDCLGSDADNARFAAANPRAAAPQQRNYKYDKLLPNVGLTFNVTPDASIFGNYSKGLSVPGTDPLYASIFFADDNQSARPDPETTDNFDVGVRYSTGRIQAQLSGFYNSYKNRLATAFDPELDQVIFRNLGDVTKYGVDGSVSYAPNRNLLFYVFGSYLESEIKDDIETATGFIETGGKREAGAPVYTLGGRVQGTLGPIELGAQVKRTGKRFVNDENVAPVRRDTIVTPGQPNRFEFVPVFFAAAPAYTIVDIDARFSLAQFGLEQTYFQLNVTNLFDELYVGGFGGAGDRNSVPFVQIGSPRAVSGSLVVAF